MCELFAMSSRLPATANFTLEAFARHGDPGDPNKDGWGIAYYSDGDAIIVREPEPAADSEVIRFIEGYNLRSTIVLSHIRHATQGGRALKNTQPFGRELGGRMHVFAHNGDLGDIRTRPGMEAGSCRPIGDTDSELAFCVLLDRMRPLWLRDGCVPPLDERLDVLSEFATVLRSLGPANFIYSDGGTVFVHGDRRRWDDTGEVRPPGLFTLSLGISTVRTAFIAEGLTLAFLREEQEVVLAASVPLTDHDWQPLAVGEILALSGGRVIDRTGSVRASAG